MKRCLQGFFLIILCSFIFISPIYSRNTTQDIPPLAYGTTWSNTSIKQIKYSSYFNKPNGSIDTFTMYIINNTAYVESNTRPSLNTTNFEPLTVNLNNLIGGNYVINDFNYFVSNNIRFMLISDKINDNYFFNVIILYQSISFKLQSTTPYHIALVSRFSNSPDVYFSVYNSTMFSIVKYSFAQNKLLLVYHTPNLTDGENVISHVSTFNIHNKIYVCVVTNNLQSNSVYSSVYLVNDKGLLLSKTFQLYDFSTFTTTTQGLLLYSNSTNIFIEYSFADNGFLPFVLPSYTQNPIDFSNSVFWPFDNDSFLMLNQNSLNLINITSNPYQSNLQEQKSYTFKNMITPTNSIRAFESGSDKFYSYCGLNNNNSYEIVVSNINKAPIDFVKNSGANISNSFSSPTNFFIILVIVLILLYLFRFKVFFKGRNQRQRNNYSSNEDVSSSRISGVYSDQNSSHCSRCGYIRSKNDRYCQDCGFKFY